MPSETNSAKERQNVRNARSRALRALETPEEKLVRRDIRNEKDRARLPLLFSHFDSIL